MKRVTVLRALPAHPLGRELYERARQNGALFELLHELTLDGLFYRDLTQAESEWTDARLWQVLGYPEADGGERPARQALLLPEDRAQAERELRRCTADPHRTYDCPLRYRHRDGSTVWVRCRGVLLRNEGGTPIRLLATHVDQTELQRTRLALTQVNQDLELRVRERTRELRDTLTRMAASELEHQRAREEALRQLIEGLPLLVWTCTSDGACNYLSPQWVAYTGISEAEQLGSRWLEQVHPDDRAALLSAWQAAVHTKLPFDCEFRIRRHDGQHRWFKTRASPWRAPDGTLLKWLGTNTDIHEQKQLEQTLQQRTAALERSNTELEAFAYQASHDLQEPLRTVTSYVQLLERQYGNALDRRAHEYVAHAVAGTRRMRQLLTDLLEYARAVSAPDVAKLADGTVALDDALYAVSALLRETSARVIREPLPKLAIDAASFSRVLQNLLSNALHYRSEAPPCVEVTCQHHGGSAVIAVKDNGIGVAPEHHRRIFQMFQRLHSQSERPGSGVGLALCKRLVERAGGQIWLESQPGRGSTFFVQLPLAEAAALGARAS